MESGVSALLIFVVFAIVSGMAFGLVRGAALSSRPMLARMSAPSPG
jgi:hypothetical protein